MNLDVWVLLAIVLALWQFLVKATFLEAFLVRIQILRQDVLGLVWDEHVTPDHPAVSFLMRQLDETAADPTRASFLGSWLRARVAHEEVGANLREYSRQAANAQDVPGLTEHVVRKLARIARDASSIINWQRYASSVGALVMGALFWLRERFLGLPTSMSLTANTSSRSTSRARIAAIFRNPKSRVDYHEVEQELQAVEDGDVDPEVARLFWDYPPTVDAAEKYIKEQGFEVYPTRIDYPGGDWSANIQIFEPPRGAQPSRLLVHYEYSFHSDTPYEQRERAFYAFLKHAFLQAATRRLYNKKTVSPDGGSG